MIKRLLLIFAANLTALWAVCAGSESATVSITLKDGGIQEKRVELKKMEDGALRFVFPKEDIPANAANLDVVPDFAKAKKGDSGYWVFPRGEIGSFKLDDGLYYGGIKYPMPFYGMKINDKTFIGIIKGLSNEFSMYAGAKRGIYKVTPRFKISKIDFAPYEDIIIDYYFLEGRDANYSGMGRFYRKYQMDRGVVKPIRERLKEQPHLEYMAKSIPVRIQYHGSKERVKKDFTKEDELPVIPVLPFDKSIEFVKAMKKAGINEVSVCSAGWQSGGYDGRFPQLFPIDDVLGGEKGLREFISECKKLGYLISAHTNSTDCYRVADIYSDDLLALTPDGKHKSGGVWSGGIARQLCAKRIWQLCLREQLKQVRDLGFEGSHYVDVFSAIPPYTCCNKNHPANRKEMAQVQNEILAYCKKIFGGASSECGYDHVAGNLDYVNYVSTSIKSQVEKPNPMVDYIAPLWEIVYHGIILSTPDRLVQNHTRGARKYPNVDSGKLEFMIGDGITNPMHSLKLVEFGGRPIFYTSNFDDIKYIKKAYDEFLPVRHLQLELMDSHERIAENVFVTTYANGAKIVSNYSDKEFLYDGKSVKPMGYILLENKN